MKKIIAVVGIVIMLGIGGYYFLIRPASTVAQPHAAEAAPAVTTAAHAVAEAHIVPVRTAALSFQNTGVVADILAEEGQAVSAGQPLARLDSTRQAAALDQAEALLHKAEAEYADLTDGPSPADLEAADARLRQAQAQLRQTLGSVSEDDLQAAQADIKAAQIAVAQLGAGEHNPEIRSAQAELAVAQSALDAQRDALSASKTNADLQLNQAVEHLIQAQTNYSTAKWNWQHVAENGTDPRNPTRLNAKGNSEANKLNGVQKQEYRDALTRAEAELHAAEIGVQQAQVGADSAHQGEMTGLAGAESRVASAQANLEQVTSGIATERLAAARAQLAGARARLSQLAGSKREDEIAVARAGVDAAQAALAQIKAPPQTSTLLALQAQIDSAKAQVATARFDLDQTELKAPFAGTLAALDLHAGEQVTAGAAIAQLADISTWQIETTDLTELSVVKVSEGAPVVITFDAIPGMELPGTVVRVKGYGESRQGDVVYRVVVSPNHLDPRLRWNMTASVSIGE